MFKAGFKKILTTNWHFVGVIVFFALNGYIEYTGLVAVDELALLIIKLLAGGVVLFWLGAKLLKSSRKSGFLTSLFFIELLFFGVLQDGIVDSGLPVQLSGRLLLVLACLLLLVISFFLLKRTRKPLNKPLLFLNTLLLIYLLIDAGIIIKNTMQPPSWQQAAVTKTDLRVCDTCAKPPIYLVILDEYMGSYGLQQYFGYNNQPFEQALQQEGFRVLKNTRSNYGYTIYSMPSMLNMSYLKLQEGTLTNIEDFRSAMFTIRKNNVCEYFTDLGYEIHNYSPFNLEEAPPAYNPGLLAQGMNFVTRQTVWRRLHPFLLERLVKNGVGRSIIQKGNDKFVHDNENMMQLVLDSAGRETATPGFYYLHLNMPHSPYTFDSTGKRTVPWGLRTSFKKGYAVSEYLEYLVYTNKKAIPFIQELKKRTGGKAVILLMSDHGMKWVSRIKKELSYYNLNALYLPDGHYDGWYDGMTNVNQFRILFNTLFHQGLPLLKDSVVYTKDGRL